MQAGQGVRQLMSYTQAKMIPTRAKLRGPAAADGLEVGLVKSTKRNKRKNER